MKGTMKQIKFRGNCYKCGKFIEDCILGDACCCKEDCSKQTKVTIKNKDLERIVNEYDEISRNNPNIKEVRALKQTKK